MPIKTLDSTTLTHRCIVCAEEQDVLVSALEAGTDETPNFILVTCINSHVEAMVRTAGASTEQAGTINGLHRLLVSLDQINANWVATLEAEEVASPDPRPKHFYTIDGTPFSPRYYGGRDAHDTNALVLLFGVDTAREFAESNAFLVANTDEEIGAFVAEVYGEVSKQDALAEKLKDQRLADLGI